MKIKSLDAIPAEAVQMEGAAGCAMQLALSARDGAPNFAMRVFNIAPNGHTPKHRHPYEHEIFVLGGQGTVWRDNREEPLQQGSVVFVPADELHQFRNTGADDFRFICLIPGQFQKC